jgi:hypothetical protein
MKTRHAIAFGLLVVGLSAAFVLHQGGIEIEAVATVACSIVLVATIVAAGGRCCIGKRCFGRSKDSAWQPWM